MILNEKEASEFFACYNKGYLKIINVCIEKSGRYARM